jgi:hypothetical protein
MGVATRGQVVCPGKDGSPVDGIRRVGEEDVDYLDQTRTRVPSGP